MADFVIPLNSTGDGSGVSTLSLTVNSTTTITTDGNGYMYDNAGGTTNPNQSRSLTSGDTRTFYIKVTSGNSNVTIIGGAGYCTKLNNWASSTNAANINAFNLSSLPSVMNYFYCTGSNTITGNLSSLPSVMTYFLCTGSNIITGNLSSLPSVMTYFLCYGSNTITGNLSSLPSVMTNFYCAGSNIITGNLSSLPSVMTYFLCTGSNTINGYTQGKSFSANMNYFYFVPVTTPPSTVNLSDIKTIGDCGGNLGITFPTAIDCFLKHTSGAMSVSNVAKWVTTDGGSTQARVPLPQDRAWGTVNSFTGASTLTMDCPRIGSIDLSAVTQAVTWALGNAISVYKSYRMGVNITQTGNYLISYLGDRSTNGSVYLGSNHPNKFNIILSNTFNNITIDSGQKLYITSGTTQTYNSITANGYGNQITISGVTAATYTLSRAGGNPDTDINGVNISYCISTGGNFFAGDNSVDGGNNTGITWGRAFYPQMILI